MASPGFKEANPTMVAGDNTPPVQSGITPISRPQYTEERKKAVHSGNAAEVAALDARARHTMTNVPDQWRMKPIIN